MNVPPTKESGIPERPRYGPEGRWKELRERMETAEAERDALREALKWIIKEYEGHLGTGQMLTEFCRAVLDRRP